MDDLTIFTAPDQVNVVHSPVPASVWLLGTGLLGLIGVRRRKGLLETFLS
jgi:hypothetical protein